MFFSYYLLLFKIIEVFYILAVDTLPITKELFRNTLFCEGKTVYINKWRFGCY